MARRRFYPTPVRSTRAQSVARSTFSPSYSLPPVPRKRALDDEIIHRPFRPYISHAAYDTSGHENFTRSEINRELIMTSAAMEDNYDIVNMSRNKDKDVLSRATRAIVNTEIHSTPRSAVAARRVMQRGHSTPPEYISKTVSQKTEAALLGRKVDVVTPTGKRRPKSKYAQNKMREIRKEHRESHSPISPENTYGLKASRPVPFQLARHIWDPELSYRTYRLTA